MCVTNTLTRRPRAIALGQPKSTAAASSTSVASLFAKGSLGASLSSFPVAEIFSSTGATYVNSDWSNLSTAPASFPQDSSDHDDVSTSHRPKRKRKPQKPGKTAKLNDRHFVVHNYHDHANDQPDDAEFKQSMSQYKRRGGVSVAFPLKLHAMLDQIEADGWAHVVSWQPHGRAFVVHKPQEFVDYVLPKYFKQSKLTSFQRQLNLYGFNRLTKGADNRGYYHELFLRGKPFLSKHMTRTKIKGTGFKAASSPEYEPDFYTMSPVIVTPPTSTGPSDAEDSESDHHTYSSHSIPAPMHQCHHNLPVPSIIEGPIASFDTVEEPEPFMNYRVTPMSPMSPPPPVFRPPHPEVGMTPPFALCIPSFPAPPKPQPREPVTVEISEDASVFDQILDDLFVGGDSSAVVDFVQTWGSRDLLERSPSFSVESVFHEELDTDEQLGNLLERIMAE